MKVDLKCFDKLENPEKCESKERITYELEDGQNVGALVEAAGIKKADIKIIFVNNRVPILRQFWMKVTALDWRQRLLRLKIPALA